MSRLSQLAPTAIRAFSTSPQSFALTPLTQIATKLSLLTLATQLTPLTFLTQIGRSTQTHADKFTTLTELFTTSAKAMKKMGVPVRDRKYIAGRVEAMRKISQTATRGNEVRAVGCELPVREKRYLKVKAFITLERMRRGGNA